MSTQLNIVVPENLSEKLSEVSTQTGLTKSEIARRGLLDQVRDLDTQEESV